MGVLDIRQRTGWLFLAVTVGHIILISTQVNTRRGVPLFEAVTFGAFAEVQRAATSGVGHVQDGWENYFALQQIRRDNEALKQEVAQLHIRLQQERAVAEQSRSLQALLALHQQVPLMTTGANVIGGAPSPDFRTMTIDKGTGDGLKPDMAVISPLGVVGRVILPTRRAAKVQLLIDRNAAAGALTERTRAQGVVVGTGGDRLRMDYVAGSADVKPGDRVVTSGIDGIYPKGFVIGQIESVQRGGGDFREITIKPAVDFMSLEAVLVVLSPPGPPAADTEAPVTGVETSTAAAAPSAKAPAAPAKPAPAAVNPPRVAIPPKPPETARSATPQVPEATTADPSNGNEER
jgi:rod shape-determining protein MreC